jgi:uroporphyrinogen-III synthase
MVAIVRPGSRRASNALPSLIMSFRGARILSLESRRSNEMAELIRISGGEPMVAPALIEVPLEHNEQAFRFADRLYTGGFEMMILLTGVGTRLLGRILATRDPEDRFREALRRLTVVARGPKPMAVLREWQVPVTVAVPEPNTWRELLAAVESRSEKSVAVQEYGRTNPELAEGLKAQGREVTFVPVYQWQLPGDTLVLESALEDLLTGRFSVVLFTTGVQVDHFLEIASRSGKRDAAIEALRRTFIASIGPDCTEALRAHGLQPAFEPSHPKMGILVREAASRYAETRVSG